MSEQAVLVGIDLGSSSVKVGAFSIRGDPISLTTQDLNPDTLDPETWWRSTCKALGQTLAGLSPERIRAVSVGGQGPTLVAVDKSGNPLGPALPWSDIRSTELAAQASRLLGRAVHSGWSYLPRVLWLRQNDDVRFRKVFKFLQAWDFISYRLCGNPVGSEIPLTHPWPAADLAKLGLDEERFAQVQPWGTTLGLVSQASSDLTGLPPDTPVIGASGDLTLSFIGSPGLAAGVALNQGGSSGGIGLLSKQALQGEGLLCGESIIPGLRFVGGPTSAGGQTALWFFRQVLRQQDDFGSCLEQALSRGPSSDGLLFLPYLAGERTPIWDAETRGVFLGLSLSHSADQMLTAVVEGITLGQADILDRAQATGAALHAVTVSGGQAMSAQWNQLKADVFGVPVQVPKVTATACLGAAAIAGWGVGIWPNAVEGGRIMSKIDHVLQPRPGQHETWSKRLELFRQAYRQTRDLIGRLS